MIRSLFLLIALLFVTDVPLAHADGYITQIAQCRSGQTRGGDYDATTGYYGWTCGNYNWSAEVGGVDSNGVSKYGSPTTVGGNSWIMTCLGDGKGDKGTLYEQAACVYAGEKIRMYSMADIQLAVENAKPHGGKTFLPAGLYHDSYCGKQPNGTANGCPVLKSEPSMQVRKFTVWGGRELIGEGPDLSGPLDNGRQGTVLISDHNQDDETDGFPDDWPAGASDFKLIACGSFGNTCSYLGGHWAWHLGRSYTVVPCAWPSGATGCDTDTATQIATYDRMSFTMIARGEEATSILADPTAVGPDSTGSGSVCINNAIATSGVCSGNVKVQCTNDTETRTGDSTGGCPGALGQCIGYADAIEQVLETNSKHFLYAGYRTKEKTKYAGKTTGSTQSTSLGTGTSKVYYTTINTVGATCSSTGRLVETGSLSSANLQAGGPTDFPIYAQSAQHDTFWVLDPEQTSNYDGGISDLTVMPAQWSGRAAVTGNASTACSTAETDNNCDELEKVNLSGDFGGTWKNIASWFGGGGNAATYAFSEADGNPTNLNGRVTESFFAVGRGLLTDGSGWEFDHNTIISWDGGSTSLLKLNFSPNARTHHITVVNSNANALFTSQSAGMHEVSDFTIIGSEFPQGLVSTRGGSNFRATNFRGWGNVGPIVEIAPESTRDVYNVVVRDMFFENHRIASASHTGAIEFTDFAGAFSSPTFGGFIDVSNVSVEYMGGQNSTLDQVCGIFFDGGLGTDAAAASGSGRTIDDVRNVLSLKNIDVSVVTGSTPVEATSMFCFGDGSNALVTAAASTTPWGSVRGPLPSWQGLTLNAVPFPDNPYRSISAAAAGDCGVNVPFGTVVLVHDLASTACGETAGLLNSTASDGSNAVGYCGCKATGAWGAPIP